MDWFSEKYKTYHNVNRQIDVYLNILHPALHFLYDEKACNNCTSEHRICGEQQCVLKFKNDEIVEITNIENFLLQFDGLKTASVKEKCDLMFFDNANKVAFCDMSCIQSKYVEPYVCEGEEKCGKRAKAYSQIESVIGKFMEVPTLKVYIDNMKEKVGLFALREKDVVATSQIEKNMQVFNMSPVSNDLSVDMKNGFRFVVIKYPTIYHW